jgi:hypothetical protein
MGNYFYNFYDESDLLNWMWAKSRRVRTHRLLVDSQNTEDLFDNIPILGKKTHFLKCQNLTLSNLPAFQLAD